MAKINWNSVPDGIRWNRLKSLRKMHNLTQPQVAVGAHISITSLYWLELGYEERTTKEVKKKLAKFFKVDVDDIFSVEMIRYEPREKFLEKIKTGTGQPLTK